MRSYCMSAQWWGGHTQADDSVWYDNAGGATVGLVCRQISKLKNPGAIFLFVDQVGFNDDAYAAIWYSQAQWWNIPMYLHSGGSVNGFVDGHVEAYKLGPQTAALAQKSAERAMEVGDYTYTIIPGGFDMEDLIFYQRASWGKTGWE